MTFTDRRLLNQWKNRTSMLIRSFTLLFYLLLPYISLLSLIIKPQLIPSTFIRTPTLLSPQSLALSLTFLFDRSDYLSHHSQFCERRHGRTSRALIPSPIIHLPLRVNRPARTPAALGPPPGPIAAGPRAGGGRR
eukprot:757046-Hanusia_phi.AAC.1